MLHRNSKTRTEIAPPSDTKPEAAPPGATSFLEGLRLDHGPVQQIGHFLLHADRYVRESGIALRFAPISTIVNINEANQASWGSFAPMLDTRNAELSEHNSYCLVGQSASGAVVATQAGRIYDVGNRTLKDLADDQSLYFGEGHIPTPDQPRCQLEAAAARKISGCLVYSGALWVHPNFRGRKLAAILPRISRAYALGHWGTRFTFAFVSRQILESPLFSMYGYSNVEPGYSIWLRDEKFYEGSLMWMDSEELVRDMMEFAAANLSEINRDIGLGGSQHKSSAAR